MYCAIVQVCRQAQMHMLDRQQFWLLHVSQSTERVLAVSHVHKNPGVASDGVEASIKWFTG